MAAIGNDQINAHPCTPEDALLNWQIQATFNENITNLLGGGDSDHKVAIDAADQLALGADYLDAKIEKVAAPSDSHYVPVRAEIESISGNTETFYWDVQETPGWHATDQKFLGLNAGVAEFISISGTVDNYTVKPVTASGTAGYLYDGIRQHSSFVSGADIEIAATTLSSGTAGEKVVPFFDVSAVSEWTGTGVQLLGQNNNATQFFTVAEVFGDAYSAGCGIDATELSGGTIKVKRTDLIGSGLAADSGSCNIKVNTNVTVKVPTSITLSHAGSTLTLTMAYQEYQIYGVAGSTGNLTATFDTTTC